MNGLMLHADGQRPVRDVIRQTCTDFGTDIGRLLLHQGSTTSAAPMTATSAINGEDYVEVPDLIQRLYAWSVRGVSSVVLGNIAGGPQLRPLIGELSSTLHRLFEDSAPLMSFPPRLAQKMRLRMWTDYERTVTDILAKANEIATLALAEQRNTAGDVGAEQNTMMAGMVKNGMPDDVIKRIFVDLILAAGDTVRNTVMCE